MVRLRVVVTNYLSIFPKVSIPKWCDCESSNELFKYFSKSFNSKMVRLRELAGSKSLLMKMFQFQNGAIASRYCHLDMELLRRFNSKMVRLRGTG